MGKIRTVLVMTIMLIGIGVVFLPTTVSANAAKCQKESGTFLGLPTWYKYLPIKDSNECIFNTNAGEVPGFFAKILLAVFEIVLRIAGMVAVVFVIWGGFTYMTSQGQPDRLKAGQSTILNALIGLMIAVLAVVIVNVVGKSLV